MVRAFGGILHHHVARVIDRVGVVAGAASHLVGAIAAVQRVVAGTADQRIVAIGAVQHVVAAIAGDRVVLTVAGAVDIGVAGQGEALGVLGLPPHLVADRRVDVVGACAGILHHHVARVIDGIGVVAGAASHLVGAIASVQRVVAGVAQERVVIQPTRQAVCAVATLHKVAALAAKQDVVARTAVDRVVKGRTGDCLGLCAADHVEPDDVWCSGNVQPGQVDFIGVIAHDIELQRVSVFELKQRDDFEIQELRGCQRDFNAIANIEDLKDFDAFNRIVRQVVRRSAAHIQRIGALATKKAMTGVQEVAENVISSAAKLLVIALA